MRKSIGRLLSVALCLSLVSGIMFSNAKSASADAVVENEDSTYDRYIAFGDDLTSSEKATVLSEFGITEADLDDYKVINITNEDEHNYLDDYLDSSVIGTRALSSVMIVKTEEGTGIDVSTKNISYCTSGMYCNALVTAGLSDADVTVVGPFSISGTSALVGAMKAYSVMTGQEISDKTMDTATDELVTTAEVAENVGDPEKVEQLVAAAKQKIFEEQLSSEDDIRDAIESSANALNIDLSDEDVDSLTDMMMKVSQVDIDVDAITEQASAIYNKLKDAGIDFSNVDTSGLAEKVGDFFANIFDAVKDFFTGLFS